jgi:hypothetical protein
MRKKTTDEPATNGTVHIPPETNNPQFAAFENLLGHLLAVPHSEIQKRVERHRKQAAENPNKPGPKGKRASASRASADDR